MKKTFILSVALCFVSICIMGQNSGTYTAKRTKVKTVNHYYLPKFEKGWYLRPEVGISLPIQFEFLVGAGYQINPYLYVGLGAGVGSFNNLYCNNCNIWYSTTFPLFATFKLHFLTTKNGFTPFFETKMGYAFGLWGSYYRIYEKQKPNGFYGHWGIGGSYKNFNLLLSYHIKKVEGLRIFHSYEYQHCNRIDYFSNSLSISLAYTIPLKKKQ